MLISILYTNIFFGSLAKLLSPPSQSAAAGEQADRRGCGSESD